MEELKSCPFCGDPPVVRRSMEECPADGVHPAGEYEAWVNISCDTCGIKIGDEYRSEAIAAWNRRLPHIPDRGYAEGIEAAAVFTNCCVCGRVVDTREAKDGGDPFGCEEEDGRWTCSWDCYDQLHPEPTPSPIEDVAGPSEAEVARLREHKWFSPECAESGCRSLILEHEVERLKELNDKYIWQVRDTCTRAEKAEADLAAAESDTRDEAYREGYEEGKSEWRGVKAQLWNAMQHWLTLRHGLVDTTGEGYTVSNLLDGLSEVEAENKRLRALSVTHSPIEDVAGPSEAEIDDLARFMADEIGHGMREKTAPFAKLALRFLAARRVRPSPVDEDARDGVLEELALFGEQQAEALSSMANNSGAAIYRIYARKIRALQSQRKG